MKYNYSEHCYIYDLIKYELFWQIVQFPGAIEKACWQKTVIYVQENLGTSYSSPDISSLEDLRRVSLFLIWSNWHELSSTNVNWNEKVLYVKCESNILLYMRQYCFKWKLNMKVDIWGQVQIWYLYWNTRVSTKY